MINAPRLPHSLTHNAPKCTDRLLALFFYSPIQKKHAQGCSLVVGKCRSTSDCSTPGTKEKKKEREAGVNELASRKPVHWAEL